MSAPKACATSRATRRITSPVGSRSERIRPTRRSVVVSRRRSRASVYSRVFSSDSASWPAIVAARSICQRSKRAGRSQRSSVITPMTWSWRIIGTTRLDLISNSSTQSRGIRSVVAASSITTGRRVSIARTLAGMSRSGRAVICWNASQRCGSRRPSAYWDISGSIRSPTHSSSEQRSTRQTCAILIAARLSSLVESSVELRISTTSRSARVSASRRLVSAKRRA